MVRNPAEVRRWLRVSGKESPIQARLAWPVRLSKGRTNTTRPPVSGISEDGVDCESPGRVHRSITRADHCCWNRRRSWRGLVTDMSIDFSVCSAVPALLRRYGGNGLRRPTRLCVALAKLYLRAIGSRPRLEKDPGGSRSTLCRRIRFDGRG